MLPLRRRNTIISGRSSAIDRTSESDAANPFSISGLSDGKIKEDGSHTFKKGESAEFNYRVIIHKSDTKAAHIANEWTLYSDPPKIGLK